MSALWDGCVVCGAMYAVGEHQSTLRSCTSLLLTCPGSSSTLRQSSARKSRRWECTQRQSRVPGKLSLGGPTRQLQASDGRSRHRSPRMSHWPPAGLDRRGCSQDHQRASGPVWGRLGPCWRPPRSWSPGCGSTHRWCEGVCGWSGSNICIMSIVSFCAVYIPHTTAGSVVVAELRQVTLLVAFMT